MGARARATSFGRWVAALTFAASLAIRLGVAIEHPPADDGDQRLYRSLAQGIASGTGYLDALTREPETDVHPLLPALVALVIRVVSDARVAGFIVSMTIGSLVPAIGTSFGWVGELLGRSRPHGRRGSEKRHRSHDCVARVEVEDFPFHLKEGSLMRRTLYSVFAAILVLMTTAALSTTPAAGTKCSMTFSMKGWSAIYKTSKGEGKITCDNGESASVTLKLTGGGLTFGKSETKDGTGKFSEVAKLEDLLGSYAAAEAEAGAVKSSQAQALTKGEVSLALSGTGEGWNLGVSGAKFTIARK